MARTLVRASTQSLDATTPLFTLGTIISIGGWMYPSGVTVQQIPWGWRTSDFLEEVFFVVTAAGVVQFHTSHAGAPFPTGATVIAGNTWTHVGAFFDSANQGLYVNGGNKTTRGSRPCEQMTIMTFGHRGGGNIFDGRLAEWGMWNVQLTDEEFAALGRGFSPLLVRPQNLIEYWPIMGRQSPEPGLRGVYPLTLTNGPTAGDHAPILAPSRARVVLSVPETAPLAPTYVSPADGATDLLIPVPLTWLLATGATSYDVAIGTTSPPPVVASGITALTYTPTLPANDGTLYYWQITARNSFGPTAGPIWTFRLMAPPAAPFGPDPADGAMGVDAATALSWSAPGATSHNVYLGTTDPPPLVATGLPAPVYTEPDIEPGVQCYYWRAEAVNAAGGTLGPVWSFRVAVGAVRVTAIHVETQLGTGFRATLIREPFHAGTWPLSELARLIAHDISMHSRPGSYVGTGFESGVPFDVPEGLMGTRLNGNQFIEVPDPGGGGVYNLSLAGGQFDLQILIKDHVIDGVRRALIAKHDGPRLTGNGFYLATMAGAVELSLVDQGVVLFRFQRGTLTTAEHLITAYYRAGEAFISIDGVKQGASVFISPTAELTALTLAPVRIGHFSDGVAGDGGGQKAVLAYPTLAREGDPAYGAAVQAQRAWSTLTPHIRTAVPLEMRSGIQGNGPQDNVATSGTCHLVLDNGVRTAVGYYTPGHPNVRPGWGLGSPVRVSFEFASVLYRAFHGRLATALPLPGIHGSKHVDCMATDWMDVAAGTPLSALPAQLNQSSDFVCKAVLDQAQGRVPNAVAISPGSGVWPFAIDEGHSERETILTELSRVASSERGFAYIRGDTSRGGLFVFEGHADRVGLPVVATFNNTMQGLEVSYGLDALVNIVKVTYTPRRVDSSAVTLYALDISQRSEVLAPGETRVFEGGYVDPTAQAERVGGTQLAPLVKGTHVSLNGAADGSGANLNDNLIVVQTLGGNSYRLELTNISDATPGFLRINATQAFFISGKGIYHYKPITIERRDNDSVRERGPRLLELDLAYETNGAVATALAEFYLEVYGTEQPLPSSLTVPGNRSVTMMRAVLALQPGHKIALGEPMTGLTPATSRFIVHEKRLTYVEPGILSATFTLAPAPLSLTLRRPLSGQSGRA